MKVIEINNVDKQKESYVLGVNRKKLIYIWRSSG